MSTAGKVLTVLILLAMVAGMVMLSAVTQLNVNWSQKVARQEADITTAKDQATKSNADALDLTERTRSEQARKDLDLGEVQGRIAAAEARLSSRIEDQTRIQYQLADYLAAVGKAETNLATRKTEKAKAEEDLAAKRVEIAKIQDDNSKLRDLLARLQDDFKRLLANNTKQANRAADRPAAQPASDRRPSPAS